MSSPRAPQWLAELQRAFGEVLRTPLERSTGTLEAKPARYDAAVRAAVRPGVATPGELRLAVYNRQYWFRLFGVLQSEHPLTTAITGPWVFNELATAFLLAHPPRGKDLAQVADGFVAHLEATLPAGSLPRPPAAEPVPRALVLQAARIDAAFQALHLAPAQPLLQLSPAQAEGLEQARLLPSAGFGLCEESWPLMDLRRGLGGHAPAAPCRLPAAHPEGSRWWALCRGPAGDRVLPLPRAHARLLRLLCDHPVGEALARYEAEAAEPGTGAVAQDVQRWLAQSMALGLWRGLAERDA